MAFVGEKLGAMFQRPQDENRDDVPWFMRYGARALGTFGGGGTTILTDMWRAYKTIDQELLGQHKTVNHSKFYVHPRHPSIHTNTVERRWLETKRLVKCHRESVLESHVLLACFRQTFLMEAFDEASPREKRQIKSAGVLLDIIFETIRLIYPGLGQDGLKAPARLVLPPGSHPFPGQTSAIIESEDEDGAIASADDEDSQSDSDSSDPGSNAQQTAVAVTPPDPVAMPPLVSPLAIQTMSWDGINLICGNILSSIANTPGAYADEDSLKDVLSPHTPTIDAILMKVRLERRKTFSFRVHRRHLYAPIETNICQGVKEAMRPLTTCVAIFLGLWNCLGIMLADVGCLLGGICQMIAGFVAITVEAPCCCMFIDHVQTFSNWAESRPYWNRAALYCGMALPGILFCFGLGSLFGSGLIFATGVMYGMMGLGKKASRDEMRAAATAAGTNNAPPPAATHSTMKSDLVSNAQPMANNAAPFPDV